MLQVRIPREVAGDGQPWGQQARLVHGQEIAFEVGPYRFAGTPAASTPPASVEVTLERRSECPQNHSVDAPPTVATWVWVSTDAIRSHAFDVQHSMLQVVASPAPDLGGIRLQAGVLGHSEWFIAHPGDSHTFQVPGYSVSFEQVLPGTTASTGHSLVRIDPLASTPVEPASVPSERCGALTTGHAALPEAIRTRPRRLGVFEVRGGETRTHLGLEARLTVEVGPPRPHRRPHPEPPEHFANVLLRVPVDTSLFRNVVLRPRATATTRIGTYLVKLEPLGPPEQPTGVRLETYRAACAHAGTAAPPTSASTVWLSTHGLESFVLQAPGSNDASTVKLDASAGSYTLGVSSPNGYSSRRIDPSLVGYSFSLGELRFQVAAVVLGDGARFEQDRLRSEGVVPALHVALYIEPLESGSAAD